MCKLEEVGLDLKDAADEGRARAQREGASKEHRVRNLVPPARAQRESEREKEKERDIHTDRDRQTDRQTHINK